MGLFWGPRALLELVWFWGPGPTFCSVGLEHPARLWQHPGMQIPAVPEGSAVPRDAARHPGISIQGMLSGEKLSPGFVSSFSCSLSRSEPALSAAVGSSQSLPLLREPRAPSDVVCPETLLGRTTTTKKNNKKTQSVFDTVVPAQQLRSCPGSAVLALPCLSQLAAGSGGCLPGFASQGVVERAARLRQPPLLLPGQHGRTRPAAPARPVLTCRQLSLPIPCPQPRGSSANLAFPHCKEMANSPRAGFNGSRIPRLWPLPSLDRKSHV